MSDSRHIGALELRVLGDFQVTRDGRPLDLPPSRKTRALLAYLAVTARQHQRERLCEIFWDIPDDPRGALRWSLSKIRLVLGADESALVADRNSVSLKVETDYARLL
ncbi:alpha/beta hydrolase, partial [bacterium M00.F.Ca.ET.155.01.1.1]